MSAEHEDTMNRVHAYQKEVDELRMLCLSMQEMIDGHRNDLNLSNGGRLSLKEQFSNLERKYARTVDLMTRELRDISFRH